ncbi:MAG: LytTR family DNA-binding domain-containing protein [Bacteroidota bacterium]
MAKVIIIDDESNIREVLRGYLEQHFSQDIRIVAEADSLKSALALVAKHEPELLLLDIHLSPGTGFDLLEQITYKGFEVIFITAYDQHAIKAIKAGALDYLLKPVDGDELKDSVNKALERIIQKDSIQNKLEQLISVSSEYFRGTEKKRVILKTTEAVFAVYEEDIYYCHSDGHYTTFYTRELGKLVITKSIKKVQELLSEDVFVRCHQSYVVNKQHVLKYEKRGKLVLNTAAEIPVSYRRKEYALARIFS